MLRTVCYKALPFVFSGAIFLSACGQNVSNVNAGVGGTILGAGTGAIIGAAISRGDVLRSAGLGAAIGLPVGVALNVLTHSTASTSGPDYTRRILRNEREIASQTREIERLRLRIRRESPSEVMDDSLRGYLYTGPTLGNAFR
jgi:hypothetical protein